MKKNQSSLMVIVSNNIKTARIEAGLTQQVLATRAGFKVSYLARLETDPQNISIQILERISKALGKSPVQLVHQEGKPQATQKHSHLFHQGMQLLKAFGTTLEDK